MSRSLFAVLALAAAGAVAACGGGSDSVAPSTAPAISSISPATMLPNSAVTITGVRFDPVASHDIVTVDGVTVPVVTATSTTLTLDLAAAPHGYRCHDGQPVTVTVTTSAGSGSAQHPLDASTVLTLAPGESRFFDVLAGAPTGCLKIPPTVGGGSYMLNVYNVGTDPTLSEPFLLNGFAGAALMANRVAAPTLTFHGRAAPSAAITPDWRHRAHAAAHLAQLARDRRLLQSRGGPARIRAAAAARRARGSAAAVVFNPAVGDTLGVKVRDMSRDSDCTTKFDQRGRVVYATSHTLVLDDLDNPLFGQIDADLAAMGTEFDNLVLPMVTANFGDPLAYDPMLGNKGHVLLFFTVKVNGMLGGGLSGFVSGCDFFPYDPTPGPFQDTVTNEAAIFYAYVPSFVGTGYDGTTGWRGYIRGVVPHETKHIASFAAKLALNADSFEESWLEESSAQVSTELYQRTYSGQSWKGNAPYATTVGCEPPTGNICAGDHPETMIQHFAWLYDYLTMGGSESPLAGDQPAVYGGAWSFLRWSVDQYASNESTMLKALVSELHATGVDNLSLRTGATFADMSPRWALATAIAPFHITPADPKMALPSWDFADIFAGLSRDVPGYFGYTYPLIPAGMGIGSVVGGGSWPVYLNVGASPSELITLLAPDGTPLPVGSNLRLGVLRVH